MKGKNCKSGKVTLAVLLGFWCLLCPFLEGIVTGVQLGIIGSLVGLVIGIILGAGGCWGFGKTAHLLVKRWDKKPSTFEGIAFFIATLVWLFFLMFLAIYATESVTHRFNA
jgi:hypothetical protein